MTRGSPCDLGVLGALGSTLLTCLTALHWLHPPTPWGAFLWLLFFRIPTGAFRTDPGSRSVFLHVSLRLFSVLTLDGLFSVTSLKAQCTE